LGGLDGLGALKPQIATHRKKENTMSTEYGPSFRACKLFRRTSQKGGTYFAGKWGGLRVSVVKSKEVADDGGEIWSPLVEEIKHELRAHARASWAASLASI
jgi:hypothetical protein